MTFLLDTNVAIYLRDGEAELMKRVAALDGAILLSIVTRVELEGGVYREPRETGVRRVRLDAILETLPVLPFDDAAAECYRVIVETAGYSRRKLLDRMIAAQALSHRATVVTMNASDFNDIPGLQILAW